MFEEAARGDFAGLNGRPVSNPKGYQIISYLFKPILFNLSFLLLFEPQRIVPITLEYLFLHLTIIVDQHVSRRLHWHSLTTNQQFLAVKLSDVGGSSETILKHIFFGGYSDNLVVEFIPAAVEPNVGVVVAGLGFLALVD